MNWSSLSDFLAMGGYGGYVWGALGMVALVLFAEVAQLSRDAAAHRSQPSDERLR